MSYLDLLENHIQLERVPFSDRGSRLLVFKEPDRSTLLVKLAERLTGIEPDIEAYLRRPPFIKDIVLIDEQGEPLDFEVTSYPHILYFHTRLGDFGLVFQDRSTLTFGVPSNVTAGVRFHVTPQYWQRTMDGGTFKSVRNVDYQSNDTIVKNEISPQEGGYTVEFIVSAEEDCSIAISVHPISDRRGEVKLFSLVKDASEARWREWFERTPEVAEPYRRSYAYAWWVMANNLISPLGKVVYEAMMPSKITYVGLWLWDSALHSLAYRHVDPELARNQIRAMLAHQFPSGMLPDAIYDEGVVASMVHPIVGEVTKPPILAWAALKLHEVVPDLSFLEEIYVSLVRLHAWWFTFNDDDGDGLVQYNHPYSSGLDDSPLWDYGMPVESPELNTYLCIQMKSLAEIAEILGMPDEAVVWHRRAAAIVRRMVEDMWDGEAGLFWALRDEQPLRVVTPFNLYPLWTGELPDWMNRRLIEHLTNPEEFWGEYVIPTVARNDPHYNPNVMWRGPIWVNINYFFIEALEKIGEYQLANEIRHKTLALIMNHRNIYEYYNGETGDVPVTAAEIFGWTAAVFIDLAIQASREERKLAETPQ